MRVFFLCLLSCFVANIESTNIEKNVMKYFENPIIKTFNDKWKKFRKPIENSIELILKETSGTEGMNVRVRKSEDYNRLTEGIIVNDNIVKVLLKDLYLSNLDKPYLKDPEVSFDLGSHVLSMESKVSRMFITAEYQLFRNLSDVTYSSLGYETSPFNLQQVQNEGEVTIVAEDCLLTGLTIATLHGDTVNLGHDSFKLRDCRFSVEITTPGLGSPPVIAPYFSEQQGMELELLLIRPIRGELMPKLQGAVYTYVNTSAMFGELLPKIRNGQNKLFKTVGQFMTYVTRYVNQMTVTKDGGIVKWEDVTISWNDKHEGQLQEHKVVLRDMVVSGLDSAYSAQKGGPYIKSFVKIDDTVRFSALQIRGVLSFSIGSAQSEYVFYGEVQDIASYVSIGVALRSKQTKDKNIELKPFKSLASFEVTGWRNLDLHAPVVPKISPRALISGVILKELPHLIIQRLSRVFSEAVSDADKKIKTNTCFLALCIDVVNINYDTIKNSELPIMHKDQLPSDFVYCPVDDLPPQNVHGDNQTKIEFRLYLKGNKDHYILLDENAMAVHKHQKVYSIKNAPLKIITHGWKSSVEDRSVVLIKDAYLETDNVNVISFDWSSIADTYYCVAAFLANFVAEIMALFLEALQLKYGVRGRDMHLIGHSLGAHVVGMAASQTSFAISRVTGLDPAAPLFEWPFLLPPSLRIDSSSADFVDIIHSCGELMGFAGPLGHEDFFPNSGMFPQPGCEDEDFYTSASCSHARAYEYFTDTIYDGTVYPSWNCESWEAFLNGKCTNVNYMGERAVQALTGNYFLFISYTSK